jgi:hypothetical protein
MTAVPERGKFSRIPEEQFQKSENSHESHGSSSKERTIL